MTALLNAGLDVAPGDFTMQDIEDASEVVNDYARRHPAGFLLGATALGFLAMRFGPQLAEVSQRRGNV
ncbi:MAG: hypothetical protein ACPGNV_04245 [Mangrovicoccus sp.]